MAVIVTVEIPGGTEELYRRTNARITEAPWYPMPGFLAHAAGPDGTGGWRVIDFWESAEAFEAFVARATPIFQEEGMPPILPRIDEAVTVTVAR
ncbi:antibiotic biosynthesis monooxygenase [Streptomyces sp. NPDC090025]|uniref:antibiotic biosynthesis monooxygenase n=1 Tax=Streptomyces sp. NPDC090025 TaxID=3365922 RepID=UPI003837AB85